MNSFMFFARRLAFGLMLALAVPAFGGAAAVVSAGIAHAAVASSIQVKGNQRIEAATIKTYLTIKAGKSYGAADIDASVKALYATSLFSDVGIAQRGSVLVVTVVENPIINSVVFEGNKKIKSDVLVQIVELKPRGVLTDAKLQADVFHIKEYYRAKGPQQRRGRGADHPASRQPRQHRLRHQRGRAHRRGRDPFRRQPVPTRPSAFPASSRPRRPTG